MVYGHINSLDAMIHQINSKLLIQCCTGRSQESVKEGWS